MLPSALRLLVRSVKRAHQNTHRSRLSVAANVRPPTRHLARTLTCHLLVVNLLIWPGAGVSIRTIIEPASAFVDNAITRIIVATGAATTINKLRSMPVVMFPIEGFPSSPFGFPLPLFWSSSRAPQETTDIRSGRVSAINITPAKQVGYLSQHVAFSAVGKTSSGNIVHGAKFSWTSSDPSKLQIDDTGVATLVSPGLVWVTASTRFASSRAPILIRPKARPLLTDSDWQTDQDQLKLDGSTGTTGDGRPATDGGIAALFDSLIENLQPTAHAQTGGGDSGDYLYDDLWSEPRNLTGSPRNRAMDSSMLGAVLPEGSNFEFSVPIEGLPGRGLPLSVGMHYNSRIWSRHSNQITFNAVNSWPYLGFTLSFGRIVTYGSDPNTKFILIDSDGTRHYLGSGVSYQTNTYSTNDGSHITYVGSATGGGTLYYNSGIKMSVWPINNRLLVSSIEDANGNYISISYASQPLPSCNNGAGFQWKQAISSITDTLGRVVSFNYDDCNNLVSITGPDQGGATTTLAQFDYNVVWSVSQSFSGLTVQNMPSGHPVVELKHVYFPATQTGYLFSYSVYGMIYNVSMRKQMSVDQYGVISDGTQKAYVTFNYPTTASSLTDAPSFTQWTQYPAATGGSYVVFSFTTGGTPGTNKTFTITRPDSSTVTLTRSDCQRR
jgi:hypothetical protein